MNNKKILLPLFALAFGLSLYRSFDLKTGVETPSATNLTSERAPAQSSSKNVAESKVSKIQQNKPTVQFDLDDYHARLLKIKSCYNNENCRYDNSDPKAYDFAVGKDLARKIIQLKSYVSKSGMEDQRISKIAREFMSLPDGHVKEAALDLISTQPPSQENLESVLGDVIESYNERLIPQALMELTKYRDAGSQKAISQAISKTLETGSFRVRQKLAEHSQSYINSLNFDHYSSVSKNLPVDSAVKSHLDAALREYRLKNTGG